MARTVIERVISDISGREIPDGGVWTMTLTPPDGRRNPVRLDISEDEARQWTSKGTEVKRRGRRPGAGTAKTPQSTTRRRRPRAQQKAGTARKRKTSTAANGRRRRAKRAA
jgi:hypothetical protein